MIRPVAVATYRIAVVTYRIAVVTYRVAVVTCPADGGRRPDRRARAARAISGHRRALLARPAPGTPPGGAMLAATSPRTVEWT